MKKAGDTAWNESRVNSTGATWPLVQYTDLIDEARHVLLRLGNPLSHDGKDVRHRC